MRLVSIFVALVVSTLTVSAQNITTLDWDELRIDSVLPHYSEVVPLASDFRNYDFAVRVEYASWGALTAAEELVARRHMDELADTLQVMSYVGQSRGEGTLDIDFIPVVYDRKGETMRKLLQCKITILATPKPLGAKRAVAADKGERWTRTSKLASGTWHKIAVESDGIYALNPDLLAKMGITDASRVRVFGYGGHMQREALNADTDFDDLEEIPLIRNAKCGSPLFWANGVQHWDWTVTSTSSQHHVQNTYATEGYYFITTDGTPAQMDTEEPSEAGGTTIVSLPGYGIRNIDEVAWFSGGRRFWENKTLNGTSGRTFEIATPNYMGGTATMRIALSNGGSSREAVQMSLNGQELAAINVPKAGDYEKAGSATQSFTVDNLKDGTNLLTIKAPNDQILLDYIEVLYQRACRLTGSSLHFALQDKTPVRFQIEATADKNVALMRIGTRNNPATLIAKRADGYYSLSEPAGEYVAVDLNAGSFPGPRYVGKVANQNLHADEPVEMVIITPASGIQDREAQRLADLHTKHDSLSCRVVRADRIYNEFSSGTPDATAYRRYIKMLYDRALADGKAAPRYLLLFGDGAWDNRMVTDAWRNYSPDDFLLCYESDNSLSDIQCYVMEDYYGLLDDGEGARLSSDKTDLGVGRFPVRTADEGRAMVDKVEAQLTDQDPGKWQNLAMVLGDDGDNNEHMKYADELAEVMQINAPGMDVRKVMWDSYKRVSTTTGNTFPSLTKFINNTVNSGAVLFNYIGHGATYLLSHESVLTIADFHTYDNVRQGFWYTAACDIAPFDGQVDNIGEAAVLNARGGARCFIGTTRTVYANLNLNLNREFNRHIFATDTKTGRRNSIGDALRLAKNKMTESGSTVNKLHYVLLGDPALVFGQPLQHVVVDSIGGISVKGSETPRLKAGGQSSMRGHIEDARGNRMTDFNGYVSARIMDTKDTVTCLNQAGADEPFRYTAHRRVLFEGTNEVTNGEFTVPFVVPIDINYANSNGRATFFAVGSRQDKSAVKANGSTTRYTVGGTSEEIGRDTVGPAIDVWLDSRSFVNGALVSAAPIVYATLEDASGISGESAGVGHCIEVNIDDNPSWIFDVTSAFAFESGSAKRGSLAFQLPVLSKGNHYLRLRAWDVVNNTNTATITFKVNGMSDTAPVSAFVSSVEKTATITIVNRLTGSDACDAQVHLYDASGHLIYSKDLTGIVAGSTTYLQLASMGLNAGIYFLQVTMQQGDKTYQSEINKVILNL